MTRLTLMLVLAGAGIAHAEDPSRSKAPSVRVKKKPPDLRIGGPAGARCDPSPAIKTLDGRQVAALLAVQRHVLDEGFRFFAGGLDASCFRSLEGYVFMVIPGPVVGVVVLESGACRAPDFRRTDSQLLYEWTGDEPLKVTEGEAGAGRAEELSRAAETASRCPP